VEPATLGSVYWHNTARLHSYLCDIAPAEFETVFYDDPRTDEPLVEIQ
jgi:putative transposase